METLFHIKAAGQEGKGQALLLEIGADHCSYAFLNKEDRVITGLKYVSVDEMEMENHVRSLLRELRGENFAEVWVCSAYPTTLLVPLKYAAQGESLAQLIYDQPMQHYFQDTIQEWQLTNSYSIPMTIFALIKNEFPLSHFLHTYTPSLKVSNGLSAADQISLHFTTQYFRVMVKKSSQVQLAQIYAYRSPMDVAYYLLKICAELQLDQAAVVLVVSGLVEASSALYSELHQYFLNIDFAQPPAISFHQSEYPQHFFSSTYNLAACVS